MPKPQIKTLQDLADIAGVSRATVSRALSDSPLLNAETRARIQSLARKHRYVVNEHARNFRLKRTSVLSVVFMLDPKSEQLPSDPFFLEILGGIADQVAPLDYDLLLANTSRFDPGNLAGSRALLRSDGVIFIGQSEYHAELNRLAISKTPMVVWGSAIRGKRYPTVGGDNIKGAQQATEHLIQLGRRNIAFAGNSRTPENRARWQGFQLAHQEAGLTVGKNRVIEVPADLEHARAILQSLPETHSKIDGLICASDVIAMAAISALTSRGLRIPEDLSIVGYDNITMAASCSPPLTTVSQNIRSAGAMLVDAIIRRINGESVSDMTVETSLIQRASCGAIH